MRKLFLKPLLLGRPKKSEPSVMKKVLYQAAEETQVQLMQLSRSGNFWERHSAETGDISLLRDQYLPENVNISQRPLRIYCDF